MSQLRFEWDEFKAASNEQKHGISFEEAQTVFYDGNARIRYDPEHAPDEERYILLGMTRSLRLLVVCHLYQEEIELIRIISARKATKQERQQYRRFFYMKNEYDFSQSTRNPYVKKLKKQVAIGLEAEVIDYFKNLSDETGIPYQSLINLYLQDCVKTERKPSLEWLSNV